MSQLNTCRHDALVAQFGDGATNDLLFQWAGGTADEALNDALYRYLGENGGTGALSDRWYTALGAAGFLGSRNDRETAFWCAGGTFALTPLAGWTGYETCATVPALAYSFDVSTLTQSDLTAIAVLGDYTATGVEQPTYQLNGAGTGLHTALFDGVANIMQDLGKDIVFQSTSIYVVVERLTDTANTGLYCHAATATTDWDNENGISVAFSGDGTATTRRGNTGNILNLVASLSAGLHLFESHFDGVTGTSYVDGVLQDTDTTDLAMPMQTQRSSIGARFNPDATLWGHCRVGEGRMYAEVVPEIIRGPVRSSIMDKWGLS